MKRAMGWAVAAVVLASGGARADYLAYGIDDANRIHEVNLTKQTDSIVFSTGLSGSFNSVAYDDAARRLYYRKEGSNGTLYEWDMAANVQRAFGGTKLVAGSADAALYQGAYWYVAQDGDTLYRAALNFTSPSTPTIGTVTSYANFDGTSKKSFGFGDVVITAAGMLYGASDQGFFRVNVAGASPSGFTILNSHTEELQLSLSPDDSAIYAQDHETGRWYTINPTSGAITPIAKLGNPSATFTTAHLRDLADHVHFQPVPEPASLALLSLGGIGIAAKLRRSRRRTPADRA